MAVYDIDGNAISGGGFTGDSIIPFIPDAETDKSAWAAYTYNDFIANVYEPIRLANPNYISREVIGRDASDTYDIYQYTFEPDYPEQTVWLQSGIHGREKDGYISLALLLGHIVNDWKDHEGLAYLRWKCRICVVPVCNPWGADHNSDNNANGVNLNKENIACTQAENIAIHAAFETILTTYGVNFAIDYHTTVNNTYGDYMASYKPGAPNVDLIKNMVYTLARLNATKRTQQYLSTYSLDPDELRINHLGDSATENTYCSWWYTVKGVTPATIELSDYVWSTSLHTAAAITIGVQCYANHLIAHALSKFTAVSSA